MREQNLNKATRLYYIDQSMSRFDAQVLSCTRADNGYEIILDKTAFFPEGGGQSGDTGYLLYKDEKLPVIDTVEKDGTIIHICKEADGNHSVMPGENETVTGILDYEKRFDKMQQHSAEHIMCGIAHNKWGMENVGFHLGDEVTTFDLDKAVSPEQIFEMEQLANRYVWENRRITTSFPSSDEACHISYRSKLDIEGEIRLVTIEGVDVCACCAPHVSCTGEIGLIKIVSHMSYKGGTRLSLVAGARALRDYSFLQDSLKTLSVMYSSPISEVTAKAEGQLKETNALRLDILNWQEKYLESLAIDNQEFPIFFVDDVDGDVARKFINNTVKKAKVAAIFIGNDNKGYRYIIGRGEASDLDLNAFAKELNKTLNGSGGGRCDMVFGQLAAKREDIYDRFTLTFK